RPKPEPCWSKRLAELLRQNGYEATAEVPYPGQKRKKCDVVAKLADGSVLWMELKGAWKEYWRSRGEWIYRSYLLHPLADGLDAKTHTVPLDIEKLLTLTARDARYLGILLIGFDSIEAPMDDDVEELTRLSRLGRSPWQTQSSGTWDDRGWPTCRVRYWF